MSIFKLIIWVMFLTIDITLFLFRLFFASELGAICLYKQVHSIDISDILPNAVFIEFIISQLSCSLI